MESMGCSKSNHKRKSHSNVALPQVKRDKSQIINQTLHLKNRTKRTKSKVNKRKKMIKIRTKINKIETKHIHNQ